MAAGEQVSLKLSASKQQSSLTSHQWFWGQKFGSSDSGSFLRVQPDASLPHASPMSGGGFPTKKAPSRGCQAGDGGEPCSLIRGPRERHCLPRASSLWDCGRSVGTFYNSPEVIRCYFCPSVISAQRHSPGSYNGPLRLKRRGQRPHTSLQWSSDKTDFNKTTWDGICLDAAIFGKYICYSKYHKYGDTVIRIFITELFTITKQWLKLFTKKCQVDREKIQGKRKPHL